MGRTMGEGITAPRAAVRCNRRAALGGLAVAAGWLASAGRARASRGAFAWQPEPLDDPRLLLARATFGATPEDVASVEALGWYGWLEVQLAPQQIPDDELEALLSRYPSLGMSCAEIFDTYFADTAVPMRELQQATVVRAALSRKQLMERVVDFWRDRFNVAYTREPMRGFRTVHEDVLRAHALGRFSDLLIAASQSPGMLYFLDNWSSTASAPNENFARELMELHTLGLDGGYSEEDVRQVARCFTGWTMEFPWPNPDLGEFRFRPEMHDGAAHTVLGTTIPPGGIGQGLAVLEMLAMHPATAARLARDLARSFLAYEPDEPLVERAAGAYLASGGEIAALLRVLLAPQALGRAVAVGERKLKRPLHFVASLIRCTGATVTDPEVLAFALENAGQLPGTWITPDGFPDSLEAWSAAALPEWEFAARLFAGELPGVGVDAVGLLQRDGPVAKPQTARRIDEVLTGGRGRPQDVAEVQRFVDRFPGFSDGLVAEAFSLYAASPSFLLY